MASRVAGEIQTEILLETVIFCSGPSALSVESLVIPIRDLPANLNGTRVVHLSDLHFTHHMDSPTLAMLDNVVRVVNQADADLILVT